MLGPGAYVPNPTAGLLFNRHPRPPSAATRGVRPSPPYEIDVLDRKVKDHDDERLEQGDTAYSCAE